MGRRGLRSGSTTICSNGFADRSMRPAAGVMKPQSTLLSESASQTKPEPFEATLRRVNREVLPRDLIRVAGR